MYKFQLRIKELESRSKTKNACFNPILGQETHQILKYHKVVTD